jgi:hypothetical protein
MPPAQQDPVAVQHADDDDEEEDDDEDDVVGDGAEDLDEGSAMPSDMEIVRLLLDQYPSSIRMRDSRSGSLPVHLALHHNPNATEVIDHLLELYPRSVTMPDGNGQLPLHVALIKESPTWEKVLALRPTTLETRDPVTGLLPFQLAAMDKSEPPKPSPNDVDKTAERMEDASEEANKDDKDLDSLSTTFRLLRMSPCLASGLGLVKPRRQSVIEQQIMVRYKPRVTKLEEENDMLRRKVEELERKLAMMEIMNGGGSDSDYSNSGSGRPSLKKRKSSAAEMM